MANAILNKTKKGINIHDFKFHYRGKIAQKQNVTNTKQA